MDNLTLRCSSLPLAAKCAASTVEVAPRIESAGEAADLGTAVHAWLKWKVDGCVGPEPTFPDNPEEFAKLCAFAWRAWRSVEGWFPSPSVESEASITWQDLGVTLTGHMDLVSTTDDEVRILDWKSGWGDNDHTEQLRGYAWLAMNTFPETERVYAAVLRVREGSIDGRYYTRQELSQWWSGLVAHLRDRETYRPGPHCRYCPRGGNCPAKDALLRQAASWTVSDASNPDLPSPMFLDAYADALAGILERAKLIEGAAAVAKEMVKAHVAAHGGSLPLPGGGELRLVKQERRSIDARVGWDVLADHLPDPRAVCSTSQGAIREEVRKGQAGPLAATMRNIMEQLEQAGAIRTTFVEKLEVRRGDDSKRIEVESGGGDKTGVGDSAGEH